MTTPAGSPRIPVVFTAGCFWACMLARAHLPHVPSGMSQDSQQTHRTFTRTHWCPAHGRCLHPVGTQECLLTGKSLWFLSCTRRSLTKKMSFLCFTSIYANMHACSVMSDSLRPHGLQPTRLLCPWNFPGENTGGVCHFLLQRIFLAQGLTSTSHASCISTHSLLLASAVSPQYLHQSLRLSRYIWSDQHSLRDSDRGSRLTGNALASLWG